MLRGVRWKVVAVCAGAAVVAALVVGWTDVRRERDFRRLLAEGDRALAAQQTSEAVELFSGAVALKPQSMAPYLKRGDTYLHRQEWSAATRDLQRAADLDPTAPQPVERLGDVALATGEFGDAIARYQRALAIDDRAPGVPYKLALAQHQRGDWADAQRTADTALVLGEANGSLHYVRGLALYSQGRASEARTALERAVALDPAATSPRLALAAVSASLGRTREELTLRESAAALDAAEPGPLMGAALAYARAGRFDQADATLQRALDRFPDADVVTLTRARVWVMQVERGGDASTLRKAVTVLRPLAAQRDASGDVLALYGQALLLDGSLAAAERALQQAVTRYPVAPDAFAHLAEAAARLGHRQAAAEARRHHAALGQAAPRTPLPTGR